MIVNATSRNHPVVYGDNITNSTDIFSGSEINETSHQLVSATCNNGTERADDLQTSPDALLYIVTVLMFYSLSMVILMVKYIRREREEAEMAHYFSEFVTREKFKTPRFEIQNYMKLLKYKNDYISERIEHRQTNSSDCLACINVPLVSCESQTKNEEEN